MRKQLMGAMLAASILSAAAATLLGADQGYRSAPSTPSSAQQELILVRAWNPETGELIGWMPLHRVAITLQWLGGGAPSFDLNAAVTADFPYRPEASPRHGRVRVVSETTTFQGRKWVPAEEQPNVIRIGGAAFNVRAIDFGESKWRRPSAISPADPAHPNKEFQ